MPGADALLRADSATAAVSGTVRTTPETRPSASLPFKYDATAPAATTIPARQPDVNGWYNQPLSVAFSGSDAPSGLRPARRRSTTGPDSGTALVSGTCRDRAGNGALASQPLKYDGTAPAAARSSRPADANGWYNHPLSVGFRPGLHVGRRVLQAQSNYAGPDTNAVSTTGTCSDRAGN